MARFILSLTAVSLAIGTATFAEESLGSASEEVQSVKKMKPQYAGVRRAALKAKPAGEDKKRKNKWFSSKTHPKIEKKEVILVEEESISDELPEDRPYYNYLMPRRSSRTLAAKETSIEGKTENGDETPATYPKVGFQAPRGHIYFTGEWLFWRLRQEGMEYAVKTNATTSGLLTNARSKAVNFNFESGFRTGLGVHMPSDGWDIYANYTYFMPSHESNTSGNLYPLLVYQAPSSVPYASAAKARWKVHFQTLSAEMGRAYYIGKTLSFRPHFGILGAWIQERAKVRYSGGSIPVGQTVQASFKSNFSGAGPLLGIESNWHLGYGFSFFGDVAASLVAGWFHLDQKQETNTGSTAIKLSSRPRLMVPMAQLVAGLGWDRNFCHDQCHFGLSAGFEGQFWADQNQIANFTSPEFPVYTRNQGDLSMYGLTLRLRLDF